MRQSNTKERARDKSARSNIYSAEILDGWLLNRSPDGYLPPIKSGAIFVAERNSIVLGFGEAAPGVVVAIYVDPSVLRPSTRYLFHFLATP
jgi:hypothetical protein